MAYASITYTSASGTTFALTNSSGDPIPYLRQADIAVTVNGTLKAQGTDYTFNSAGTSIVFNVAVSNATVVISRTTDISDATVVYTAGSTLTAQDLNNADNQIRYGLQEFSDVYDALRTGTGDLGDLGGFIDSGEVWVSDNGHAATTGAIDGRIDTKIDTALTTDVVAGDSITVTDNSPGSGQITIGVTNASISTAKLVDASVTTAKIADANVTTAKIADANVTTAKIADSNVTTAKIADSAVTSAKIADGTIVASDLASDAVTTAKILDANVTTGKIADGAVTTGKLADSSVTSGKIADGTIVAGDLASDSVTTAKILDANVTTAKIADSAVTTGKIADSAVTAVKIADGVITSAKLNASTVVTAAEQAASTPDDTSFFTTSASDARYVNVTGDTMSGALAMGTNKITGVGTPTASGDAANKSYVDGLVAAATLADADYGDITVSGSATVWTIDNGVVTSAKIADGTIVDGDINASAAIAGTKISPDFGSQNTTTTGTSTAASFIPTSSTVPTNGVYLPSANNVAISTNGAGKLFINSAGDIGIGAAPSGSYKLEVKGGATDSVAIFDSTNAVGPHLRFSTSGTDRHYLGSAPGFTASGTSSDFAIRTAGYLALLTGGNNERLRITSDGKLGLGTSSPQRQLTLSATIPTIQLVNSTTGGGQDDGVLLYENGTNFVIENQENGEIRFATNGSQRAVIDSSGRLGIGTTSPGARISLGTSTVDSAASDAGAFRLYDDGSGIYGLGVTSLQLNYRSGASASPGAHVWFGGTSERARIDSSGRLLLGTSSARSNVYVGSGATTPTQQIETSGSTYNNGLSLLHYSAAGYCPILTLGSSQSNTPGANALLVNGTDIGVINFAGNDGTNFRSGAFIQATVDGTSGSGDLPTRLVFSTCSDGSASPTERLRITNNGYIKISNDNSYTSIGTNTHGVRQGTGGNWAWMTINATVDPYGIRVSYTGAAPNGTGNPFIECADTGAARFVARSNGGLANYSANNVNLSDRNVKKDIVPAAGTWDCLKEWEIVNFRYKDQPDDADLNMGVIAQQVAESCPEVITVFQEAKEATETEPAQEERLGVKDQQMMWMAIKALQEAQLRIETLEAEVAVLKGA
jgi:uncharacterized protein YjbI with pentapeptide repeats